MKINDVIRTVMKKNKITQTTISKYLNITQQGFSNRLNLGGMTVDSAVEILNALGYELVVQPKTQGRRREGQILIDE